MLGLSDACLLTSSARRAVEGLHACMHACEHVNFNGTHHNHPPYLWLQACFAGHRCHYCWHWMRHQYLYVDPHAGSHYVSHGLKHVVGGTVVAILATCLLAILSS